MGLEKELAYSKEEKDLEATLLNTADKMKDFSKVLSEHKYTSKFFEFLKKYSHPKVQFFSLELNNKNRRVDLSGKAESFHSLGEQILIFRRNKDIQKLRVHNIYLDRDGKVNFSLTFSFSKDLIKNE
jgi:hypothetical protein